MSEGIPNAPELGLGAGSVSNGAVRIYNGNVAIGAGENGGGVKGEVGGASDTALSDLEAQHWHPILPSKNDSNNLLTSFLRFVLVFYHL